MRYTLKGGRIVNIPDKEIANSMTMLHLSKDEAIQMWLEDEGIEINAEQQALDDKAKAAKITASIHGAKAEYKQKTQKERVQKDDIPKENLIAAIAELLKDQHATDITITNKTKYIEFKLGNEWYTVNLIRNTKKNKAAKAAEG